MEFTGDQASLPADIAASQSALAADDLTVDAVADTHFGVSVRHAAPTGYELAATIVAQWLDARF